MLMVVTVLFISPLITASVAEARHSGSSYSSATSRAIADLDNDEVEELYIPVLFGVTLKAMSPNFGDDRDGGSRTHEGQDIMAILGTPMVTPTEAVVTSVGTGESAGKYVYTANPGGESFRYMHLDEIADIKAGDVLKAGDYIGTVGNTGNASGGLAHLHFEIKKGEALDPFPRITKEYTLKEKMVLVVTMFRDLDDEDDMAEFLVDNYTKDFSTALNAGYTLPTPIKSELSKRGIVDVSDLKKQLDTIVNSIPAVLKGELTLGAQGTEVSLLQFYLIYKNTGPAAAVLGAAGSTGYFGPVTAAAVHEYQLEAKISATQIYDAATRLKMMAAS